MPTATEVFDSTMDWLKENYTSYRFFTERDIVWTVHLDLLRRIEEHRLPFRISYTYPLSKSVLADLVILDGQDTVEVAVEFKYEPSHRRADILRSKLPVVFWTGPGSVAKDVERMQLVVANGTARVAYSVFIEEGGFFRHRAPHPGCTWIDWEYSENLLRRVSVLRSRVAADSEPPKPVSSAGDSTVVLSIQFVMGTAMGSVVHVVAAKVLARAINTAAPAIGWLRRPDGTPGAGLQPLRQAHGQSADGAHRCLPAAAMNPCSRRFLAHTFASWHWSRTSCGMKPTMSGPATEQATR